MFSRPKILFLVSLLFVSLGLLNSIPTYLFKFLIFYHSSLFAFYTCLSIHNNLSVGAQNVTGAVIIIMLVYRRLLTTRLHDRAAV